MITSNHNPKIQTLRELLAKRRERERSGQFVVDGVRLAEEALAAGWLPQQVYFSAQLSERGRNWLEKAAGLGMEIDEITPDLMDGLADTEAPQGLLAVFPLRALALPSALDFMLVVDGVRDPGNLGTLLRSAAAAGVQAAVLAPGTVDGFAPKVLRAGMGAQFRLPVMNMEWEALKILAKEAQPVPLRVYLAVTEAPTSLWQADLRQPLAIVVGGEAEGASPAARAWADERLAIPMPGRSESLNAAAAASIILFEVVRQRKP